MEVAAQWVRTYWTKDSRGAPGATRRNAVQPGFLLPETTRPLVHEVTIREWAGFAPVEKMRREPPDPAEVKVVRESDLLRIRICPSGFGKPYRRRRPPAVELAPGEWLRWRINYRFVGSSGGQWYYCQATLNLANGPVTPEIFLGTPDRIIDELAHLR
ncbi:hypothetical protein [Amycolatopsis sp. lyj-108]|uniref:hypothetical protein n=1 Tax=Amycolatopsis sp. lyj-108 TaxID=2789286 RepID=UPI00397CE594